jgi:hypothetical protein
MSDFQPIRLGDRAKDSVTGLQGIVVASTRYLTGSIRMAIQPEGLTKDGEPIKSHDFDQSALVLVDHSAHKPLVVRGASRGIDLGDRAKHRVTGLVGIVESVTDWLHGCSRLGVKPEALHEGSTISREYFDEPELDLIDKRVHTPARLAVEPAPAAEPRRSNGGPARESAGFRR